MLHAGTQSSLDMATVHSWKSCLVSMSTSKLYAADVTNKLLSGSSKWQTNKLHVFPEPEQSTGDVPTLRQGPAQQRYTPSYSELLRLLWLQRCYMNKEHALTATKTALSQHCTTASFDKYTEDNCLVLCLQRSLSVA